MTSMIAPLGRLRTQRRSPAVFSVRFFGWLRRGLGLLQPRESRSFGACCDRASAVRPTATRYLPRPA